MAKPNTSAETKAEMLKGIWLGHSTCSNANIMVTALGIHMTESVKRFRMDSKYDKDLSK